MSQPPSQPRPYVAGGDIVYRRFDPSDHSHWTVDEGGQQQGRLRSGALRWDPEPEPPASPTEAGCSVYQRSKLRHHKLVLSACLDHSTWRLASVDPADVRQLKREALPDMSSPFDTVESPYPRGEEGAPLRDAAHADIRHDMPGRGLSKWYSVLAKKFALVVDHDAKP